MREVLIRAAASMSTAVLISVVAPGARSGEEPPRRLGDHPAIVVQRLAKSAGYDYASKFYPHPAWLRLYAAPPSELDDKTQMAGAMAHAPTQSLDRP